MKELESKWREIVSDWESSGESQVAYSRRVGLPKARLSYWQRRLKHLDKSVVPGAIGKAAKPAFVELVSTKPVERSREPVFVEPQVELQFGHSLILRIRG